MLGVRPIIGGLFSADDEQYGKGRVAVISEGLWRRRYGAELSIIGKNIEINRKSYRIAGVIRPILEYRFRADVWMPLAFSPADLAPQNALKVIDIVGRLKDGVAFGTGAGRISEHRAQDGRAELVPVRAQDGLFARPRSVVRKAGG
jgi:putative ABC transport system permease protein